LLQNPHPGEILLEEFLSRWASARTGWRAPFTSLRRINEIVLGKRDITADTDLRLARYRALRRLLLGFADGYD